MPVLESSDFGALFRNAASSAFRLETLPVCNPISEADKLRSYLAGEPCPKDREPTPYMTRAAEQTSRGIDYSRVHVFTGPPTDYLRYEMECATPTTPAARTESSCWTPPNGRAPTG